MQHRYKINTSCEGRKSSSNATHSQKNDTLVFINLLDKCTQILRQDRIWIRNQLKGNDEQIIKIFKQARRPLNMQHLQIKLRKHVTAVKSKAKMEQLMKFKQNMHLTDWTQSDQKTTTFTKKDALPQYHLPSSGQSSSNAESRGLKARMNNSMDKISNNVVSNSHRNTSANGKKNLENYNVPMQQITERQSQNMTSARNQIYSDEMGHQNFTFSHTYQQWKRPELSSSINSNLLQKPFEPKQTTNSNFNNYMEQKKQQPRNKIPSAFEKNKYTAPTNPQIKYSPPTNAFTKSQTTIQAAMKMQNKSIKASSQQQQTEVNIKQKQASYFERPKNNEILSHNVVPENTSQNFSSSYLEEYSPHSYKQHSQPMTNNFLDTFNKSYQQKNKCSDEPYMSKDILGSYKNYTGSIIKSSDEETDLLHSKTRSIPFSSNSNTNDSLFTSPQLLAQCRNFLKLKSNSKLPNENDSQNIKSIMGSDHKFVPLNFDHEQESVEAKKTVIEHCANQQNSTMHMINEINWGMANSYTQPQQFHATQPMYGQYNIPNMMISSNSPVENIYKQQQVINQGAKPSAIQQYFHTFAGLSSQKKEQITIDSPQTFVDILMDNLSQEPEGFVYWDILCKLVEQLLPHYMDSFRQYLLPTDQQKTVLISNVGRLLEDLMSSNRVEVQSDVKNLYRLLDIQQKGYIVEQDIQDFIQQLEDSQAQDIETISKCIWNLFEKIDQDAEQAEGKRVDYWGIYSKKHSPQFEQLNEILKQFEFQIE